jgi:alpha-ketoglutarate-dependent taurine dioxygenase
MNSATLNYRPAPGPIGTLLELDDLAELARAPGALDALRSALDERLVVRVVAQKPIEPEGIAFLTRALGEPALRGGPKMLPDYDFIQDFSVKAKHDDGRPRVPRFIESLHYDVSANGPVAYGILHTRVVVDTAPMRFVDMRAVYAALPDATRSMLTGVSAAYRSRDPSTRAMQPLAARHPRTGAALLLLPNLRDTRLDGLPEVEGRALCAKLWHMVEASSARYESVMRSNELYLWDNIAAVHDNPAFPRNAERVIWFLNVARQAELAVL